ncbi:MAG: sigma-70 family RNA polymerase sigma factor [SAR324 cluster bacterium]|nr:sigma-70 family RNA polymerase sigma factor [SAR324 cluster bacterium]
MVGYSVHKNKVVYLTRGFMDDDILIQAHKNGDKRAFEKLVHKHQRGVGRLILSVIKHENKVPDVLQEVFIAVYRGLKNFRGDSLFKTWLYRITLHESIRYMNKESRKETVSLDTDESFSDNEPHVTLIWDGDDPETTLLNIQNKQILDGIISHLSPDHRLVLHLHYQEDLLVENIAEILEIPVGSVKSRLYYARLHLKKLMEPVIQQLMRESHGKQ